MINRQSPAKLCCLQINRQLASRCARIRSHCTSVYYRLTLTRPRYALYRNVYTSNRSFFFYYRHFVWDASQMGSTAHQCLVTPPPPPPTPATQRVSVYTCAGKCGLSISLCIQKRDFGIASRLFRHSLPSVPLKGTKKKTDDFTFALQTLQPVPEILHEHPAHRSCYS